MGVFKKGKDWWIDYYVIGRRKREKIGPNRRLAETVLQKRKVEIAEGKFLDKRKEVKVKFSDLAGEYLEYSKANKRSFRRDVTSMKQLIRVFGSQYLHQIKPKMIEDYKNKRLKENTNKGRLITPAAVNRELACLKNMFTKATEWGMTHSNPTAGIKNLKEPNGRLRYLNSEEARRLVNQCAALEMEEMQRHRQSCIKSIVITALNTGMRKGEILNLKWSDIDFQQGIILLENTKNGQRREVPINRMLTEALKSVKSRFEEGGEHVFCDQNGNRFKNVRRSFNTALKRAGVANFRFHDLRHTFASHLVMAAVDLVTVKELLGHKSIDMTMRYSHLSPNHKKNAVSVLDVQMDTNMDTEESFAIIPFRK